MAYAKERGRGGSRSKEARGVTGAGGKEPFENNTMLSLPKGASSLDFLHISSRWQILPRGAPLPRRSTRRFLAATLLPAPLPLSSSAPRPPGSRGLLSSAGVAGVGGVIWIWLSLWGCCSCDCRLLDDLGDSGSDCWSCCRDDLPLPPVPHEWLTCWRTHCTPPFVWSNIKRVT